MHDEDQLPSEPRITDEERERAWAWARETYPDPSITGRPGRPELEELELLNRYLPDAAYGYLQMRRTAYDVGPNSIIDAKTKEMLLIAMGLAARKTNPWPMDHTRLALEAGATVEEIGELVALSVMYCGAITWGEGGRHILRVAHEWAEERSAGSPPAAD